MNSSSRPPTPQERELLGKLLEGDFPGCRELRQQLEGVSVRQLDEDGDLELTVAAGPVAPVRYRVPTEGMCPDGDGVMIQVLLHVIQGRMRLLEIYKVDGSKVLRRPAPEAFDLFRPGPLPI